MQDLWAEADAAFEKVCSLHCRLFAPSDDSGAGLRAIGRYQPASGVTESLLAATTEQRDGLRVGRLVATQDETNGSYTVHVRATARFSRPSEEDVQDALRPFLDNAEQDAELDRQIAFTDGLIDQIVYRLYGLSDCRRGRRWWWKKNREVGRIPNVCSLCRYH